MCRSFARRRILSRSPRRLTHTLPDRRFAAVPPRLTQIRLLDEIDETLAFAQQLQDAGCALLAVHGRYRGSPMRRRDGPAHLDQVALIKQRLSVPVVTNGNVRSGAELVDSLLLTGADGAMTAEGALDDPAIFAKAIAHAHAERSRLAADRRRRESLSRGWTREPQGGRERRRDAPPPRGPSPAPIYSMLDSQLPRLDSRRGEGEPTSLRAASAQAHLLRRWPHVVRPSSKSVHPSPLRMLSSSSSSSFSS